MISHKLAHVLRTKRCEDNALAMERLREQMYPLLQRVDALSAQMQQIRVEMDEDTRVLTELNCD